MSLYLRFIINIDIIINNYEFIALILKFNDYAHN